VPIQRSQNSITVFTSALVFSNQQRRSRPCRLTYPKLQQESTPMKQFVAAKFHGIYVTEANLNYHGSITLDPDHCEEVGILPMEYVDIWNKNSGARISTYVIYGERGSKCCILNGAAARTCQAGDQVIICSFNFLAPEQLERIAPKILTFAPDNSVVDRLTYDASRSEAGELKFSILDNGEPLPVPLHEQFLAKEPAE